VTIGIVVGAVVLSSGLLEGRYQLHMLAAEAEGLTQDTRVELQGLEIGRVTAVNPHLDSATNRLDFVATLSIRERFPDGTRLQLPIGTKAIIAPPPTLVGAAIIEFEMPPPSPASAYLQPGDTVDSERRANMMEALLEIASGMKGDVLEALTETRELVVRTTATVDETGALLANARPQLDQVLDQLSQGLERTNSILAQVEPRVGPVSDSIMIALETTNRLLVELDSLAITAHDMASENREDIDFAIDRLTRSAVVFEHFAEQLSRRPLRMLWGVTPPPPPDSAVADSTMPSP
jgi:ABC-type transporter Mla subunit MlaD